MEKSEQLYKKLKLLPDSPGVYIMKDRTGEVIYVGKAISLKNRVRQYFNATKKEPKVAAMVQQVYDFDYIMVDTEKEALILECNLIKKYMPHYNILLKDDKHYPFVRIDLNDPYPRVEVVRSIKNDGAKYFGPYTSAIAIRDVLDTVSRVFPIRQCKKDIVRAQQKGERPCLNYAINRCSAPCAGKISQQQYMELIGEVIEFLSGKHRELITKLEAEMKLLAEGLEYEKCAVLRDRIQAIRQVMEKQKAAFTGLDDKDIFAVVSDNGDAVVQVFLVRSGKLSQTESFLLKYEDESEAELLSHAVKMYYLNTPNVPKEIFTSVDIADRDLIQNWLEDKRGKRVYLRTPRAGDNRRLVELARNNAAETLNRKILNRKREYEKTVGACRELQRLLRLPEEISRMECYDISNIQGTDSVASMVVFTDGKPDKKEYRHFRIKTVEGADDFRSMAEVLERRFLRYLNEKEQGNFGKLPDLLIVDGGKGQLHAAYDALASLGMENIPMIGLAKKLEEVFLPFEQQPLLIDHHNEALKLLQRIRDEAHRFAITYHRSLRQQKIGRSELMKIPGVGPKKRTKLLRAFHSVAKIKQASLEELRSVVDARSAQNIHSYFHPEQLLPGNEAGKSV